jgi:hypothetical protein
MRSSSGYGPYRKKYYQGDPWHPKPFLKGKRVTFPYEHDSVVLYSGINKHLFFDKKSPKKPENSRSSESILKTGKIPAGPEHQTGGKGVYFGFTRVAEMVAKDSVKKINHNIGGAVLEVQIPSKNIITIDLLSLNHPDYKGEYRSLDELKERFGTVEKFWRFCQDNQDGEKIQWKTERDLPLKYVTGVWDVENSRKPIFTSFKEFLKNLKSQYGEHIPDSSNHVLADLKVNKERKQILEETEEYKQVLEKAKILSKKTNNFNNILRSLKQTGYSKTTQKRLKKNLKEFNSGREEVSEILETEFDVEDSKPVIQLKNLTGNLSEMEELVKSAEEGLKEAIADEQEHYYKENWNKKDIKKEQFFEERVEDRLGEMILQLPFIQYENIEEVKSNLK